MKQGQNIASAHRLNQRLVLRTILMRRGIARQNLAQITGLTPATITNITARLITGKWIAEEGQISHPGAVGRRSIGLGIASGTHYVAAVHLQRRVVSVGLAELDGSLVATAVDDLEAEPDPRRTVDQVQRLLAAIIDQVQPPHLLGVGVGASGIVDYDTATIQIAPSYGWANVALGEWLAEAMKVPVVLDNNARGMALAEHLLGSHRDARWLVFLYVGRGMAAGIWADGRIYRGIHGFAGEVGHTTVVPEGDLCWCKNRGCLEIYLSEDTLRRNCGASEQTSVTEVFRDASTAVRRELVHQMATALINVNHNHNPEVIVLGGWVDKVWPMLRDPVMEEVAKRTAYWPRPLRVVSSSFGENIGLIGAAAIGLGQLVYGVGKDDGEPLPSW